jgi:hypothetical protein
MPKKVSFDGIKEFKSFSDTPKYSMNLTIDDITTSDFHSFKQPFKVKSRIVEKRISKSFEGTDPILGGHSILSIREQCSENSNENGTTNDAKETSSPNRRGTFFCGAKRIKKFRPHKSPKSNTMKVCCKEAIEK